MMSYKYKMDLKELKEELKEFLSVNYQQGITNAIFERKFFIILDFKLLQQASIDLANLFVDDYSEADDLVSVAIRDMDVDYDGHNKFEVFVNNYPINDITPIKALGPTDFGKMVAVEGLIGTVTEKRAIPKKYVYECPSCGNIINKQVSEGKVYEGEVAETQMVEVKKAVEVSKVKLKIIVDLPEFAERAAESGVDLWRLRTGRLSQTDGNNDFDKIQRSFDVLSKAPIFIDDTSSCNILQMRSMARRIQADKKLGLIIVDYLQLMEPRNNNAPMVQQMTEVSRSLKGLAKELNIPVLALSQLSRAVEQRSPQIPRLSDLRDTGAIEQDADVVMFIHREDKYRENTDKQNIADIIIAKHRNGPVGKIQLYFDEQIASFRNIEKHQEGFSDQEGEEEL